MKRLIGTKINSTSDSGKNHSDTVLEKLKTIQNTDGVLEAWLGEHNTYYITLGNLRVVCLKESQLPTLRDHILNTKEDNADMRPPKMEENCSQQDSPSFSLNIKNLVTRTRQKEIEAKTSPIKKQTTDIKVKNISGNKVSYILKDSRLLDDKRLNEEKLKKLTEIAAKYLKTMGVVQDIEPLEILTHLKKESECSFRDIEAFFESKDSKREIKTVHSDSFLPGNVDVTGHAKERIIADTTKAGEHLKTPNIPHVLSSTSPTEQTRQIVVQKDSTSKSQNNPRVRYIRMNGKGRNSRIRIPGADTLGGLPDNSDTSVRSNSNLIHTVIPKRSFSMPETLTNQQISPRNLISHLSKVPDETEFQLQETVSEPASSVLGVTFIVGGSSRGSSFDRDITYGNVSSDFKSNSDFFSSRECSQEKVSWLKDSTCARLVRGGKENSDFSPMTSTEVDKETQVLRGSSSQKNYM